MLANGDGDLMVKALVITAPGINCDLELEEAFQLGGATTFRAHINELMDEPSIIDEAELIGLPGGFSYGDAVAAGRIMAQLMRQTMYEQFISALNRGVPMIAPCNGFQIAVQLGLLPGPVPGHAWPSTPPEATVALAQNTSARFIDKWVGIDIPENTRCIWTKGLDSKSTLAMLPIAHGEGRFVPKDDELLRQFDMNGQIACRYRSNDNPNGSVGDVMGICDASGLILGLMPHPERYLHWTQHPYWTRLDGEHKDSTPMGLQMFKNAISYVEQSKKASIGAT